MSLIYISDTNIWIDFRNAGLLEQMFKLPFALCCTDFVLYELEDIHHGELLAQGLLVESFDEQGVQKLLKSLARRPITGGGMRNQALTLARA